MGEKQGKAGLRLLNGSGSITSSSVLLMGAAAAVAVRQWLHTSSGVSETLEMMQGKERPLAGPEGSLMGAVRSREGWMPPWLGFYVERR